MANSVRFLVLCSCGTRIIVVGGGHAVDCPRCKKIIILDHDFLVINADNSQDDDGPIASAAEAALQRMLGLYYFNHEIRGCVDEAINEIRSAESLAQDTAVKLAAEIKKREFYQRQACAEQKKKTESWTSCWERQREFSSTCKASWTWSEPRF